MMKKTILLRIMYVFLHTFITLIIMSYISGFITDKTPLIYLFPLVVFYIIAIGLLFLHIAKFTKFLNENLKL